MGNRHRRRVWHSSGRAILPVWIPRTSQARPPWAPRIPPTGAVAFAVTVFQQRDCRHDDPPPSPCCTPVVRVRRLPLPARRDPVRGPLVPPLWPVLPRRRGAPDRARRRSRPRHDLPVGAALHAIAGRRRSAVSTPGWRSLAGGRDLREDAGQWRYVYRAIDQFGQVIDVFVLPRRDAKAARRFFERAIGATKVMPVEITTELGAGVLGRAGGTAARWRGTAPTSMATIEWSAGPASVTVAPSAGRDRQAGSQRRRD
jgi:hypothetical protein